MNVIVVGDFSSTNLGDPILTKSALHIVDELKSECGNIKKTAIFDIAGRPEQKIPLSEKLKEINHSSEPSGKRKKDIKKNYSKSNKRAFIKWLIKDKKIFEARLKKLMSLQGTNVFVIAGGALLSRSLFYALRINEIIKVAEKCNGKVIFNAVGIEKCPATSVSRIYARKFLSSDWVIAFSTRDQVDEVSSLVKNKDFIIRTPDPGIFAAEAFGVEKKNTDIVGIGTISLEAYKSVVFEDERADAITTDDLFSFWYGITSRLDEAGQPWKVFTNGGPKDCQMAYTFLKKYNYDIDEHLVLPAETPDELVEQISQFKVVAAHRLHALIIASSLYIPVVPFVWSDKVVKFSESIKNKNYFWPDVSRCSEITDILCCETDTKNFLSNILNSKKMSKEFLFEALTKEEIK